MLFLTVAWNTHEEKALYQEWGEGMGSRPVTGYS